MENGKTNYFEGYLKNMNYLFFFIIFQIAFNDFSDIHFPTCFSIRNSMFISISIISDVTGEVAGESVALHTAEVKTTLKFLLSHSRSTESYL